MTDDISLRITALDTASRLGLPSELTLRAARAYLAFLEGREQPPGWELAGLGSDASSVVAARLKSVVSGLTSKRAAAKKAIPARRRGASKR